MLQTELKKNCKASLILLPKRKRRLQRRKKREPTIGMAPLDATATVPVDRKKPIGAHLKFEKKYAQMEADGCNEEKNIPQRVSVARESHKNGSCTEYGESR